MVALHFCERWPLKLSIVTAQWIMRKEREIWGIQMCWLGRGKRKMNSNERVKENGENDRRKLKLTQEKREKENLRWKEGRREAVVKWAGGKGWMLKGGKKKPRLMKEGMKTILDLQWRRNDRNTRHVDERKVVKRKVTGRTSKGQSSF